jgi:hypothetical protein
MIHIDMCPNELRVKISGTRDGGNVRIQKKLDQARDTVAEQIDNECRIHQQTRNFDVDTSNERW